MIEKKFSSYSFGLWFWGTKKEEAFFKKGSKEKRDAVFE